MSGLRKLAAERLLRGVLFHPSQYENLFLSLVHTAADVTGMLSAAQDAFAVVGRRRKPQAE